MVECEELREHAARTEEELTRPKDSYAELEKERACESILHEKQTSALYLELSEVKDQLESKGNT